MGSTSSPDKYDDILSILRSIKGVWRGVGVSLSCPSSLFCSNGDVGGDHCKSSKSSNSCKSYKSILMKIQRGAPWPRLERLIWKWQTTWRHHCFRFRWDKNRSGWTKNLLFKHSIYPRDVRSSILSFQITWASIFSYFWTPMFYRYLNHGRPCFAELDFVDVHVLPGRPCFWKYLPIVQHPYITSTCDQS